jgi:MFS family permease
MANDEKKQNINWKRFTVALVYLGFGVLILFLVGRESKFHLEVDKTALNLPRYFWCLGWAFVGFGAIVFRWVTSEKFCLLHYIFYFPILLGIISAIVFSVCHLSDKTSGFVFYYLSAGLSAFFSCFHENILGLILKIAKKIVESEV